MPKPFPQMETPLLCELLSRVRRQYERYQFHVDAELEIKGRKWWGHVKDISRSGMFIELADPPRVGATFFADLALNAPLRMNCEVRHVAPGRGVGVTFTVAEDDELRFEALLMVLSSGAGPSPSETEDPQPDKPQPAAVSIAAGGFKH